VCLDDLGSRAGGFDAIEEPGKLHGAGSVDLGDIRQLELDGTATDQGIFNVRDRTGGGTRVGKIERSRGNQTGVVALAVGADGNIHSS
jgi:hypothetical protein